MRRRLFLEKERSGTLRKEEDPENREGTKREQHVFIHLPDIELLLCSRHCEDPKVKKTTLALLEFIV